MSVERHATMLAPVGSVATLAAQARAAEDAGLGIIACPQAWGSPFVPLAHIAAYTSRVRLQTGVLPAFTRSPFETAMTALDLDRLCDGRLILGLGPSYKEWHDDWYGMPSWGQPVVRMREVIEIIRLVESDGHKGTLSEYRGTYYTHDWSTFGATFAAPLRPRIPIWLCANGPAMVRLAAKVADGLTNHLCWSVDWARTRGAPLLADALANAGRKREEFHWQANFWTAIHPDRDQALHDARATVATYAGFAQFEPLFTAHGYRDEARAAQAAIAANQPQRALDAVTAEMANSFVLAGTPDECRTRLATLDELVDSYWLVPIMIGLAPEVIAQYAGAIAHSFYQCRMP